MNLQPVIVARSGPLRFQCTRCNVWAHQSSEKVHADLDGPSFEAYYCQKCADEVRP